MNALRLNLAESAKSMYESSSGDEREVILEVLYVFQPLRNLSESLINSTRSPASTRPSEEDLPARKLWPAV